eukprot:CAMPEP_0119036952 /NCGR_PEP_ID=MMETSP1177-20130426/4991_1 /TAXON_ID=2985 /ORGANISM="Ochromonas sp, Strain CCMP1899" /LENGTH=45 /DNA_ID= /DNA_START= /DNA_END= /DNA_ORIENTATION=
MATPNYSASYRPDSDMSQTFFQQIDPPLKFWNQKKLFGSLSDEMP